MQGRVGDTPPPPAHQMSMNDQMTAEFMAPEIMHPEHFGPVCETLSSPVQPVD